MPIKPDLTPIEKDKLNIDPDFDFRDIARRPFYELKTNEIGMFKWTGIYHQLQKGFFMVRLRTPGGLFTADQLDKAADLAEQYAQGELCITTRQTLQLHWIRKEDLYQVLEGMEEVGINSKNACGDVTRNVITCSLQGVCPHEIGETRAMLERIAEDPELKDDQRNLPRKHKISVSGCGRACGQTLMNCQGWYPVKRFGEDGVQQVGWKYHAGGGLGARPFMAQVIFDWVPEELVLDVTRAATEVFNRHGNRRVRAYARLKYVVDQFGPRGFGEKVLEILRERGVDGLDRIEAATDHEPDVGELFLDGQPVIAQRQTGFNTVRPIILRSELTAADARRFAGWSRDYGNGTIMFTNRQNLELRFVPDNKVDALLKEVHGAGYRTDGLERLPDMVACVGTTQCNLAVSDTPNTYRHLYRDLAADRELWEKVGPLRINMNGCPNSCAQHWIADIGLRGTRKREEIGSEEGFDIFVGGRLSGSGHIGEHVCMVTGPEVSGALRQMLEIYLDQRRDEKETFGAYSRRIGGKEFARLLGEKRNSQEPVNIRNIKLRPLFHQAVTEHLVRKRKVNREL